MLACTRRLTSLSAWRNPRTPSALNRAYHNLSFSARPNTLSAKIWYRRDGVPRSILKGVRNGVFVALLSFIAHEGVNLFKREREQNALVMLVRIQPTDLVFSSADLSTTRGAIEYLLAIFCLLLDEHHAELLSAMYADLIKQVDSGQLSPGTVEMIHKTAKETAEGVHTAIEQAKARELPVQRIVEIAYGIKDILREHLRKIQKIMLDVTDAKKIESIRNALARIEGQDRRNRKSDGFDVVK